jgi:sulfur carrier protein ThiS
MEVQVQLYSILREKLPASARGRAVLYLDENATLDDLLRELDIERRVVISVNGQHAPNGSRVLKDHDEVKIFSSVSGGTSLLSRPPCHPSIETPWRMKNA